MPLERPTTGTSVIDVLDHVLDKGIVVDAWVRVSLVGIDLLTVEARVVVASIETYLQYSAAVGIIETASRPAEKYRLEKRHPKPARGIPFLRDGLASSSASAPGYFTEQPRPILRPMTPRIIVGPSSSRTMKRWKVQRN